MWIKRTLTVLVFFVSVLMIAALPEWILILKGESVDMHGSPLSREVAARQLAGEMVGYVKGIWSGESFTYQRHFIFRNVYEPRSYFEDMGPLFLFSAVHLVLAGSLALLAGLFTGLVLARSGGVIRELLEFLVTVPDFATAFFLQLLVVFIYKQTGFLVGEVFSTGVDTAILLPFITLFILPFVYTVRQVSAQAYQVLTEDYILMAKAKGLDKRWIYVRHVTRNVLPVVEADLVRLAAILTGNLIVIEKLFNSPGVTRFLFSELVGGHYATQVNNLWVLILLFLLATLTMRGTLFGLKRGLAHD